MKNLMKPLMLLAIVALFAACKKTDPVQDTNDNSDIVITEALFEDMGKVVDEAMKEEGSYNKKGATLALSGGGCATVTFSFTPVDTFPVSLMLDFGTANCMGADGRNRRGKLSAELTGRYRSPGSVLTITPDNYYVQDHKIEGQKKITNNGRNSSNNLTFTVNVINGKVTFPDGKTTTINSTRTNEWTGGENTLVINDDTYLITGSANGKTKADLNYTAQITNALDVALNCKWIRGGVLEITPANLQTRVIDYGTGTCDNKAKVSIGNYSVEITLP